MGYLLFALREILPAAVLLIPFYCVLQRRVHLDMHRIVFYYLISCYLCGVYALVGLPNITYFRFDFSGNLIPFRDMLNGLRSTVQNVLLFVPLGLFLPFLDSKYRELKHTVGFGFFTSLCMELLQIFTYRATDVNDLITNTLGTFLGYVLAGLLMERIPVLEKASLREDKRTVPILFGTAACVMFFLQPFAVMLL